MKRLLCLIALISSNSALGQSGRIPIIKNLGVLPLHPPREEISKDLQKAYDIINKRNFLAARMSSKYKVANDDLIASFWSDAEGRAELAKKFEIQGYLNTDLDIRDDAITIYARLLDPKLNIYLMESENRSKKWFRNASAKALEASVDHLIFRLFNRIPVDATVTSVQAEFITLSGGEKQGLKVGDKIGLYHVYITQTHPANGSWLKFKKSKQGDGKIIEVLEQSSVARLTRIKHDSAIAVGDGVRIPAIESRNHFRRLASSHQRPATAAKPIELTPLYRTDRTKERGWRPKAGDSQTPAPAQRESYQASNDMPATDGNAPGPFAKMPPPSEPPTEIGIEEDIFQTLNKAIDDATVLIGPRLWKISGSASAAASFIPANYGGLLLHRTISKDLKVEIGGGVFAGVTKNGSFSGFNAEGEVFYHQPLNETLNWRVGGGGGLYSMAVNEETYGGGDIIQGFMAAGVYSTKNYSASSVDWHAILKLRPLNTGRVGVGGAKEQIKSSMGTSFRLGGILNGEPRSIEWGGMLELHNLSMSLGNNKDLTLSEMVLMLLGRLKF